MSVINQNGNSVITSKNEIIINGEKIPMPKGMKTHSQSIINGKIYIDGYEYFPKSKKFKRTLRALWELLF